MLHRRNSLWSINTYKERALEGTRGYRQASDQIPSESCSYNLPPSFRSSSLLALSFPSQRQCPFSECSCGRRLAAATNVSCASTLHSLEHDVAL
ncbi:hypothetical protein E2C01_090776 [Portunus trituberculatus]|uniref:Uncharacterized protein n=1 Tax=Portunus trituberculatus TaxID=210409 RepID=A0A5B7JL83_PORTR|nr:hypothetical protein [Portunus trituberculatus]